MILENIRVEVPSKAADQEYEIRGPALPFFHNTFPASITGIPSNKISGIQLKNIEIKYEGGGNKAYANMPLHRLNDIPENEEDYPEYSMFGELPAWGIYMRHIDSIYMNNILLSIEKADYRPAIVLDYVVEFNLKTIEIQGDPKKIKIYQNGLGSLPLD